MFKAYAPSNIAIIKYMGKKDPSINLPDNPSLSLTLDGFRTEVSLKPIQEKSHHFQNQAGLSEKGIQRVLRFFDLLDRLLPDVMKEFGLEKKSQSFEIESQNTFPAQAGLASSASSFAALTLCYAYATSSDSKKFLSLWESNLEFKKKLSTLSRQGSGSSCRSLDGPWVLWSESEAERLCSLSEIKTPELVDLVLLVDHGKKAVSSSEAHLQVKTSPLWNGRPQRVEQRVARLKKAILIGDLKEISKVAWEEMWEMHSLFHTADPSFSYFKPETIEVLNWIEPIVHSGFWTEKNVSAPIVTLDAGPNPHIIVPKSDQKFWTETLNQQFPKLKLISDQQGFGAKPIIE